MTRPIAKGLLEDHNVRARLAEIDECLRDAGVDTRMFSARELCLLPKAQPLGKFYAIPPTNLWPRMAATITAVAQPIRIAFGSPCSIKGYRPRDYNKAVGGAPDSRHIYFEAVDMRPIDGNIRRLRDVAADMFVTHSDMAIGLGLYGGNIHVDLGHRRRAWGSRKAEIIEARERLEQGGAVAITAVRGTGEWTVVEDDP